jgi:hypothetical protein
LANPTNSAINIISKPTNCRPGRLALPPFGIDSVRFVTLKTFEQQAKFKETFRHTENKTDRNILLYLIANP